MLSHEFAQFAVLFISIYKSNGRMEGYIVEGLDADISSFPHAVFLAIECKRKVSCGSSVLNQHILVTAGHCLESCDTNFEITCFAGSSDVTKAEEVKEAVSYVIHRDYDSVTMQADVGLLMVKKALPFGLNIRRVIIRRLFPAEAQCEVAGWGVLSDRHRDTTTMLKRAQQKVWTFTSCNRYQDLLSGMICATSGGSSAYPFKGDSGNGLVTKNNQLIGVVSFRGRNKADLVVYTNVSYYYDWIAKTSQKMYCTVFGT